MCQSSVHVHSFFLPTSHYLLLASLRTCHLHAVTVARCEFDKWCYSRPGIWRQERSHSSYPPEWIDPWPRLLSVLSLYKCLDKAIAHPRDKINVWNFSPGISIILCVCACGSLKVIAVSYINESRAPSEFNVTFVTCCLYGPTYQHSQQKWIWACL